MQYINCPRTFDLKGINAYTEQGHKNKLQFHKDAKKFLTELASELGLQKGDYFLRTEMAGIAVCGETTLHGDAIYIQLSNDNLYGGLNMLYRTCRSNMDFSGDQNHTARVEQLRNPDAQARLVESIRTMMQAASERNLAHAATATATAAAPQRARPRP